jgi:hypothetical protein
MSYQYSAVKPFRELFDLPSYFLHGLYKTLRSWPWNVVKAQLDFKYADTTNIPVFKQASFLSVVDTRKLKKDKANVVYLNSTKNMADMNNISFPYVRLPCWICCLGHDSYLVT